MWTGPRKALFAFPVSSSKFRKVRGFGHLSISQSKQATYLRLNSSARGETSQPGDGEQSTDQHSPAKQKAAPWDPLWK